MKTTLDLPDELMRRVKIRAAERNEKLKDTIADLLQNGFATPAPASAPTRTPPVRLKGGYLPTADDIEAAIVCGRD